ncbi:MAG: DNA repair protein RecO [Kangiellaceae bacterium]|nr:DNA repair protein RecO [Kangiellaceae bacterium]
MNNQITSCFVLHSRSYKETSLIADLFSLEFGRFSVIANGIKRKNAQAQRAILQPFRLLKLEYRGRSELKTLCSVDVVVESKFLYRPMPSKAIACGYYVNELLLRTLQLGQEFPWLFDEYRASVEQLHNTQDLAHVLRNFEVSLLSELGIAPDWFSDISGEPIENLANYVFNIDHGFEKITGPYLFNSDYKIFPGQAITDLGHGYFHSDTAKMSQQVTQLLLRQVIGHKPLESRKLWI